MGVQIEAGSGHGIDIIAKARFGQHRGEWVAFEVKTGFTRAAPGPSNRQAAGANAFARDVLGKAARGDAWWVPGISADHRIGTWARRILTEQGSRPFAGYLVRNHYIGVPGSVDVKIAPWRNPAGIAPPPPPQGNQPNRRGRGGSIRT